MRLRNHTRLLFSVAVTWLWGMTGLAGPSFAQQPAAGTVAQPASPQIQAVMDKIVHLKKAKVGDPVSARVTEGAKLADGTEIGKGSHLIGKVTAVKSKPDSEGPARLGLLFTEVQSKDGKHAPVEVALMSVAPPYQAGGVDLGAAENRMSGAQRTQTMNGDTASANAPGGAQGNLGNAGLGIRSGSRDKASGPMQPGVSYLEDVSLVSYSMGEPGTVLESKKGTFYVDSGCRLLFMGK